MANEVGQPIINLRDYLRAIWSRKLQVAAVALVVTIAVLFLSLRQTPLYLAEAKVLVLPTPDNSALLEAKMTTEAELVRSDAVVSKAGALLGTAAPTDPESLLHGLGVTSLPNSTILVIGYESPNADTAAQVANAFAEAYVNVRSRSLAQFAQRLEDIRNRIARLRAKIAANPPNVTSLQTLEQTLVQNLADLKAQADTSTQRGGEVVQPAEVPSAPASPDVVANTALALVLGLVLGIAIALVRDAMDKRVRSREDLERRVGAPVLAVVPRVSGWRGDEATLMSQPGSRNAATEAYGTLATNVRYGGSTYLLQVLTVTSALPGEGKTVTSAHLGVALAQAGSRVLIVSADLRRPRIHTLFGLDGGPGLTDAVMDSVALSDVVVESSVPMLSVLRSGPLPDNPVAFLARLQRSDVLKELRESYDVVVLDSPPVLPVADAAVLASMSDGVVFVHSPLKSSRQALMESRDRLRVAGARIIGVVYNNVDLRGRGKYYGAYSGPYLTDAKKSGR